jgi:hypothetical protein
MYGMTALWAEQVNTRGSRGNDPDFERYLRTEYLGGATLAALRRDSSLRRFSAGGRSVRIIRRRPRPSTRERVRSTIVRIVATMIVLVRRAKSGPADREA